MEHSFPQEGFGDASADVLLSNNIFLSSPPFSVSSSTDEDQIQVLFHRFLRSLTVFFFFQILVDFSTDLLLRLL